MLFFKTARFYQVAPEEVLDQFENAMDDGDCRSAERIMNDYLGRNDNPFLYHMAKREPDYLAGDPEVGDLVYIMKTGRYARLITVSKDKQIALVKEMLGVYTVPYETLRRVR